MKKQLVFANPETSVSVEPQMDRRPGQQGTILMRWMICRNELSVKEVKNLITTLQSAVDVIEDWDRR